MILIPRFFIKESTEKPNDKEKLRDVYELSLNAIIKAKNSGQKYKHRQLIKSTKQVLREL